MSGPLQVASASAIRRFALILRTSIIALWIAAARVVIDGDNGEAFDSRG